MKQPTYNTNWERDLARCADALEKLLALLADEQPRQSKAAKTPRERAR